ncbi:nitroreductase family protein [Thermoflavimicrobium dichotomicum]|uniref:Nitroreductase n=1 Tax=Thermoflavimicrobium dichotomicum TaxID=46223 RepID=A0A1I3NK18_9BACL|nr:nitroreductase family protein [Thermoflavimicrobium dichotomicum]SFJ09519.1 Nitroreductase [Thermoflavimicrobium dichotomicum]
MKVDVSADFMTVVNERHSVRKYDPTVQLSKEELEEIIEIATKAPSSWNLQHWKFLVINDREKKEKLLPIAYHQEQVVQASAVIAVLGDLEAYKNAEPVYDAAIKAGYMKEEVKKIMVEQIAQAYETKPYMARDAAILNASLASMQLMLAAKAKGYDTCAMGGFDPDKLVEAFKIPDRYLPVMLISVGKAAKPAHPTVRFPVEDVTVWNSF